jgi:PAS domain S-box-containing protein
LFGQSLQEPPEQTIILCTQFQMQGNLRLIKLIGWQPLDLAPPQSSSQSSTSADGKIAPHDSDMWRTLFDHAPCAIAFADRQGRLIRVNRKFCNLVGYPPTEIIHRGLDKVTWRFGVGVERESNGMPGNELSDWSTTESICAISKCDGSIVWCRQTTVSCGDQNKKTDWTIFYFDELSDSKQVLQLLVDSHQEFIKSQKARLETLVGALADGPL